MSCLPIWLRAAACAFAILPTIPALADAPAPVAAAAPVSPPAAKPALWKVADADTTIWLFGTIHVLPEEVDWHTGPVAAAFDAAQELVTEIPMDDVAQSQEVITRKSLREDGRTLRAALSEPQRKAYEQAMAAIGLPPEAFDRNDTWLAALMLTLIPLKAAGYNTESGIDGQVAARARTRHLVNHAFETAEYQIDLFDTLPEATQRAYLGEVIEALPTVKADIDAMVAAWKAGDADHLAQLLNEDESDPQMRKVLITDRNVAWAKWLEARLDRPGTVFVAVGAGHLAGAGSVQEQLAAAGVASTRVQ
ncbi:TraB/GumN family protein [Novosphingobium sp. BL-52-GroH]|uniref:TraB/GumN family protein n=1 Tax=Novosphingobium sp. BL-52-GroH TaxID=3349877 RepID=UPI00384E4024